MDNCSIETDADIPQTIHDVKKGLLNWLSPDSILLPRGTLACSPENDGVYYEDFEELVDQSSRYLDQILMDFQTDVCILLKHRTLANPRCSGNQPFIQT